MSGHAATPALVIGEEYIALLRNEQEAARAGRQQVVKLSAADMARARETRRVEDCQQAIADHLNIETSNGKSPCQPRASLVLGFQIAVCYVELVASWRDRVAWNDTRGKEFLRRIAAFGGGTHPCLRPDASATVHIVPEYVLRDELTDECVDSYADTFCAVVRALGAVVVVGMGKAHAHLLRFLQNGKFARSHITSPDHVIKSPPLFYAFEGEAEAGKKHGVVEIDFDIDPTAGYGENEFTEHQRDLAGLALAARWRARHAKFRSTAAAILPVPERLALWQNSGCIRAIIEGGGIVPFIMSQNLKTALVLITETVPERLQAVNTTAADTFFSEQHHAGRAQALRLQKQEVYAAKRAPAVQVAVDDLTSVAFEGPTAAKWLVPATRHVLEEDIDVPAPARPLKRVSVAATRLQAAAKKSKSIGGWAVPVARFHEDPEADGGEEDDDIQEVN